MAKPAVKPNPTATRSFFAVTTAVGVLLLVGGAATTTARGAARDDPPPAGTPAPPKSAAKGCRRPPGGRPPSKGRNTMEGPSIPNVPFCGTPGHDTMHGRAGNVIYGQHGNDIIDARNGQRDNIYGGPGRDVALTDSPVLDTIESGIERVRARRPAAAAASWRPAQFFNYPFYPPAIQCQFDGATGGRMMRIAEEPTIRAADATRRADWQTVAYSPLLYRWDGTQWVFVMQNIWLWDRVYDTQFDNTLGFPGNFWRRFDTNQRWFLFFRPPTPGSYRLAVRYRWYREGTVPDHEQLLWGGFHYGEFEDPEHTHTYCYFPR